MYLKKQIGPVQVTLPDGRKLNRSDLPPTDVKRWVVRHKIMLLEAVAYGLCTREYITEIYGVSAEEFDTWQRLIQSHGPNALKATALKKFR